MSVEQKVSAMQINARLRGVSPPVTCRLLISEQASLAQLHATLQVAFGWSDEHLYTFQIRGWQFGDPARAIELALAGGDVSMPPTAFAFEINETFRYHYNLFVPWEIDCRVEFRTLLSVSQKRWLGPLPSRSTQGH
jgi:Plasmid pRiA4b ORF-3-like protein